MLAFAALRVPDGQAYIFQVSKERSNTQHTWTPLPTKDAHNVPEGGERLVAAPFDNGAQRPLVPLAGTALLLPLAWTPLVLLAGTALAMAS